MVEFDVSQYPVLLVKWTGETSTEDIDKYTEWLHAQIAEAGKKGDKIIAISETLGAGGMDSRVRKYMNEQLTKFSPAELEVWLAPYMVLNSPIIRGLIKAITWMSSGQSQTIMSRLETFADRASAIAAARARLAQAGSQKAS